jgi:hypothetical protein
LECGGNQNNWSIFTNAFLRHAGLDPASRDPQKHWIPAFAGMTTFLETVSLKTNSD